MKLPPSPRIIFEGDPTAALPFVGIAKKWARAAYTSGIRARTYVLGDARIRVENYPESYLSKVFIKVVPGFPYESGLYQVPPDSILYDRGKEVTHLIYYGDWLDAHFSSSGQWQGRSVCNKDNPFTKPSPYKSKIQTRDTAQVADRFQPAMFTGLARLMMQGKLAAGRNPDKDIILPLDVSMLLQKSIFFIGWFGDPVGCIVDDNGVYWLAHVSDDAGLRVCRLKTKPKCNPDKETEAEKVLRISYELSTAETEGAWISLLSSADIKEHTEKLVEVSPGEFEDFKGNFGHGWHWRRQTINSVSKASMVVVEKDYDPDNSNVDYYVGRIVSIKITWNNSVPLAEILEEDEGEPIRPWIIGHVLTYPSHVENGYKTWCIEPPLDINLSFEPYEDNITPVYCFYDEDGELVVVEYVQRYVVAEATGSYEIGGCLTKQLRSGSGGYNVYKGGWKIRGSGQPIDPVNPSAGLDKEFDFSQDIVITGGGETIRETGEITNVGGLVKFSDNPLTSNRWYILGGTMYAPNLFNFLNANEFPSEYKYFEHWGQPADKKLYYTERSNPTNIVTRAGFIIPFSDAEAVTLLGEQYATWGSFAKRQFTYNTGVTPGSGGPAIFLNGGEVRLFYANPDGSKGPLAETRPFSTLFSKHHTIPRYLCCSSTSNIGNPCYPSNATSGGTLIEFKQNQIAGTELRGVVLTSTYSKSFEYEIDDWFEFFEILDCDEILTMPIYADIVSAFKKGGMFNVTSFTSEIDTDDGYESVPFAKGRFIGGA
jgi:hypothetical protein